MITSPHSEPEPLRLTGALEIYQAESVRQTLLQVLAEHPAVALDLGAVESCDAAGAQLLWAARKTALAAGKAFRVQNVSQPIRECWAGLGLPLDFFPSA